MDELWSSLWLQASKTGRNRKSSTASFIWKSSNFPISKNSEDRSSNIPKFAKSLLPISLLKCLKQWIPAFGVWIPESQSTLSPGRVVKIFGQNGPCVAFWQKKWWRNSSPWMQICNIQNWKRAVWKFWKIGRAIFQIFGNWKIRRFSKELSPYIKTIQIPIELGPEIRNQNFIRFLSMNWHYSGLEQQI